MQKTVDVTVVYSVPVAIDIDDSLLNNEDYIYAKREEIKQRADSIIKDFGCISPIIHQCDGCDELVE